MLVLSRQVNEEIVINPGPDEVRVRICAIRGDKVRIGIAAPPRIEIDRDEVAKRKAASRRD